jgi:hypothetical protein
MNVLRGAACSGAVVVLVACSTTAPLDADMGAPRDATVVDSTLAADAIADAASDGGASDAGRVCGGSCDPLVTHACGAGMRCTFTHGTTLCAPATDAGLGRAGDPCQAEDACGPGLACFATMTGSPGQCVPVCCPWASSCSASQRCRGDGTLIDAQATAWGRCLPPLACDLAHPDRTCAAREGCYIVDQMGDTECLIAGNVPGGGACGAPSDCTPGYTCAGLTARTCVQICFLASTAPHQGCGATSHCEAQSYSPAGTGICVP